MNNGGNNGYCGHRLRQRKNVQTIITEAIYFFSVWAFSHKHSRFTGQQQEKWEVIFLLLMGDKLFGQRTHGEVIVNGRTNDQIIPSWGKSFRNDKCIFQ